MKKESDYEIMRRRMVDEQLTSRGIIDPLVISAFENVPRHEFVPEKLRDMAYGDHPLPIGGGQTISQPYMVALMTQCLRLKGGERILEIGTGCGYQSAILARIAKEVYSVERLAELSREASGRLKALGYFNCAVITGDGTLGLVEFAPYDGIIVTAGAPHIPGSLCSQLKNGGRLVIPVGGESGQVLTVLENRGGSCMSREVCGCVFVPLIGKEGWSE